MTSTRIIVSTRINQFACPATLKEGKKYLFLERNSCGRLVQETVQFVSYTACPGTVIVLDSQNHRFCISRNNLFIVAATSEELNLINGLS
ncbi:MAG TPA: hypothetical protein VKF38_14370 [Anaerolineaceae bacterium]|nr:hypothetical protein [Anaerolineaceae bacterium]